MAHYDDHEMDDDNDDHGRIMARPTASSAASPKVTSSLQMAAKKSPGFKFAPKRQSQSSSTSYQIGGETSRPLHADYHTTSSHSSTPHSTWNAEIRSPHASLTHHCPRHHTISTQQDHTTIGYDTHPAHSTTTVNSHEMEMETEFVAAHEHNVPPHPAAAQYHPHGHHHHTYSSIGSSSSAPIPSSHAVVQTTYTIGADHQHPSSIIPSSEKMVGVEDHGHKAPMVVLDGANVAHAYGTAVAGMYSKGSSDPDASGIQVAVEYFQSAGLRVLVVLPQYWFRSKPQQQQRSGNSSKWNISMDMAQQDVLNKLQTRGLIVTSPPADDDDAYALTIARREEARSLRRNGEGPGFVLSNDMFRDAQARDTTNALMHWLNDGRNETIGPGRISYSFADMGTMNDHGERVLDFVPNPRHPLVIWIEGMSLQGPRLQYL